MMQTPKCPGMSVCGIGELPGFAARHVSNVLSITDPDLLTLDLEAILPGKPVLRLRFHDIIDADEVRRLPALADMEEILAFGRRTALDRHVLVHCHTGVSRSTAAMIMLLAQRLPDETADSLFEMLRDIRPQAWPNSLMVGIADQLLQRNGTLSAALRHHYRLQLALQPSYREWMTRLGREREVAMAD